MSKERLSLTLDKNLLSVLDRYVDGLQIRNRSHAIEFFLTKALKAQRVRKAFILAGGKGTRLRPITYEIPKPMVPIQGRPILEHTINLLRRHDIRDIIISTGYLGHKIKEYFGDGSKFGVKINYIEEDKPLGTAGSLRLASPLLNEPFIMVNGDNLFSFDLDGLVMAHKQNGGLATMALVSVEDPSKFGVAVLKGNKIVNFVEKPERKDAPSNLINAGVYILEPEIINYLPNKTVASMIEKDIFPKLVNDNTLFGYILEGQWFATDDQDRYANAIKKWNGA